MCQTCFGSMSNPKNRPKLAARALANIHQSFLKVTCRQMHLPLCERLLLKGLRSCRLSNVADPEFSDCPVLELAAVAPAPRSPGLAPRAPCPVRTRFSCCLVESGEIALVLPSTNDPRGTLLCSYRFQLLPRGTGGDCLGVAQQHDPFCPWHVHDSCGILIAPKKPRDKASPVRLLS